MIKIDKTVTKTVFWISVILIVCAIIIGAFAVYKNDIITFVSMIVVLVLQINNVRSYLIQNSRKSK